MNCRSQYVASLPPPPLFCCLSKPLRMRIAWCPHPTSQWHNFRPGMPAPLQFLGALRVRKCHRVQRSGTEVQPMLMEVRMCGYLTNCNVCMMEVSWNFFFLQRRCNKM